MMKYSLILSLLLYMVVTGCVIDLAKVEPTATAGPPLACDELVHPALLSAPFEDFEQGPKVIKKWILTEFPNTTISRPGGGYYVWQDNETTFQLVFVPPIQSINQVSDQEPTIGNILNCFGDPEFFGIYRTRGTEASGVAFDIWYPNRGMFFYTSSFGWSKIWKFTATSKMNNRVSVVPPGTPEEMLRSASNWDEKLIKERVSSLQEWPEDFTELRLEE